MHSIYIRAKEDYLLVLKNMRDLICNARPEHISYYNKQYRAYMDRLKWVNTKLSIYH